MKKRSPITQASHKNIPGSAQMLSHTAREGASWRSKQRQSNMCKSQWEEKGKNNVTLSSLAPQWSWNEFGCIGNCFFQFKKCPKRFRNSRKAKTQKNNHFFFLIILGKPETQIKICSKNAKAFYAQVLIHIVALYLMWMKSGCLGQLFWSQPNQSRHVESVLRKIQSCYASSAFRGRTDWRSKASACQHCKTSVHQQWDSGMGKSLEHSWGWPSCMDRSWNNCAWATPGLLHQTT